MSQKSCLIMSLWVKKLSNFCDFTPSYAIFFPEYKYISPSNQIGRSYKVVGNESETCFNLGLLEYLLPMNG